MLEAKCWCANSSTLRPNYVQECEFSARHFDEDCKANIVIEQHSRKTKPPRDNDLSRINTRFASCFGATTNKNAVMRAGVWKKDSPDSEPRKRDPCLQRDRGTNLNDPRQTVRQWYFSDLNRVPSSYLRTSSGPGIVVPPGIFIEPMYFQRRSPYSCSLARPGGGH